ncbi:hypothetical protein LTR17_005389 [Elasticomyces elasticus]|nr:hypothetical protein LTR17_005389 [Elasticomyces elasticus]
MTTGSFRAGHSYEGVVAKDNARIHNGDVYTQGPVTIITTAGTVSNVIGILDGTITKVHGCQIDGQDSEFILLNLLSQLGALRTALGKLQEWTETDVEEPHHQLRMDLDRSLHATDSDSAAPNQPELNLRSSAQKVENLQGLMDRQIGALNLLLTACYW